MTERQLTCIICPKGCVINVSRGFDGGILNITGNSCARGRMYAETECTNPKRTVTTTMRCTDGGVVAVKTDRPIPKASVMDCMEIINRAEAKLPVHTGDVLLRGVFGSNIVAAAKRPAK